MSSSSLSEIRIEKSASAIGFSDPCPCCGNKKRRCVLPSPASRKKLLVFDHDDNNADASSLAHLSTPSPDHHSAPSISFSVPTISNSSTPSMISPKSPSPSNISSVSLPSSPLLARPKTQRLLEYPFGHSRSELPNPTRTPPRTPSPDKQQPLERPKSSNVSDGGSWLIRSGSQTPPMTPTSGQHLLEKSDHFTPTSTPPRTPTSSNQHLLERSNSNLKVAPLCSSKVAMEGRKGDEVRIGVKCGCGILREIVIIQ